MNGSFACDELLRYHFFNSFSQCLHGWLFCMECTWSDTPPPEDISTSVLCISGYRHFEPRGCRTSAVGSHYGETEHSRLRFRSISVGVDGQQQRGNLADTCGEVVGLFHLAIELIMSRCAALSLFVSVNGGILLRSPTTSLAFPKYTSCNRFLIFNSMSSTSLPILTTWL